MPSPATLDCDRRFNLNGPSMATGWISAFWNFKALILGYFLTIVACARTENVAYCNSVPMQYEDGSHNLTLPKFDSSLGILKFVDIGQEVNLSLQVQMENTGPRNFSINSSIESVLTLHLPDAQEIKANASMAILRDLEPFDGDEDFSDPYVINLTESSSGSSEAYYSQDMSGFVAGRPGEKLLLQGALESKPGMNITGSASSQLRTNIDSSVCVSYGYNARES